jgi:DNA segregation ATPase FtsK/SpoIIIE, S-DNA-T family
MAARKDSSKNKHLVSRIIFLVFVWIAYTLFTLACVSYHSADPPSGWNSVPPPIHNWCGAKGAWVAFHTMRSIGPGIFVAIVLGGIALFQWTRRCPIKQFPLRAIGTFLLVMVVSSMAHMLSVSYGDGFGGGNLGIALGDFLRIDFGLIGAWLLNLFTLLVGALLAADEFVLALPARLHWTWQRLPAAQVAAIATGAASGVHTGFRGLLESFSPHTRMGKAGRPLRRLTPKDSADAPADDQPAKSNAKNSAETPESPAAESAPAAIAEKSPEPLTVPAVPETTELVVRKHTAPKQPTLPFKPITPANPKTQDFAAYRLPGLDLLDEAEPINMEHQEARVREKAKALEAALVSFGIDAKVEAIDTGPVVTLYELGLAAGVKSSQVAALAKDIARALMSPPVRIIDNIPGKSTMGIEVPNLDRERVRLKELFQMGHEEIQKMTLPMCLGKDASGNALIEDLTRMPHMLIAGTTGSGKSVCINSIIMTLLLTQRPDHVKMIMVDPKMVEMQDYKSIPHLMAPIIDDMSKAESILEWATQKMDERYEILSEAGVRHIKEFNKLSREQVIERFGAVTEDDKAKLVFHIPYIIIIIDELADLMMTSKEVEGHIVRIAQKARAVGIHLILATQRPEAQVVTGLIKSNMPGRICFQVRSRLDSRIMLDQSGGELLLGQGDMLMLRPTGSGLVRGQGAFVDDKEMKGVCKFLKDIAEPEFHPELLQLGTSSGLAEGEEKDPLYNDAVDIMIESGRGSVSLVQRRLNIGYSRASRLIDQMRRTGIVGAYKGSQASEVVITKDEWEAMKAAEGAHKPQGGDGSEGSTGGRTGTGPNAGFAQQVNTSFDEDEDHDDNGVPDEMPGEHRL